MGIDWSRMVPKPVDPDRLDRLVAEQARAFRAWQEAWPLDDEVDAPAPAIEAREALKGRYVEASRALRDLLEFPDEDPDPDFRDGWRVYPIAYNRIFPPGVRHDAYRTILPRDLPGQLGRWQAWASAVALGRFGAYQLDLFVHEQTVDLYDHNWTYLRETAVWSLDLADEWARIPELAEVRSRILESPEPYVHPAPIGPIVDAPALPEAHEGHQLYLRQSGEILELNRDWNRLVPDRAKVEYRWDYGPFENPPPDASDPWLLDFFGWACRCRDSGMGLFLDY